MEVNGQVQLCCTSAEIQVALTNVRTCADDVNTLRALLMIVYIDLRYRLNC